MKRHNFTVHLIRLAGAALLTLGSISMDAAAMPDVDAIALANNAFAADLYAQLAVADGNLFFSPYSISLAFGMAGSGAGGNTADQMGKVLHFGGKPVEAAPAQGALQDLLNQIQSKGNVRLAVANSIWPEQSYPFRKDYLALLARDFKVSVSLCNFKGKPDAERKRINRWVEDHTNDRIQDLMPDGSVAPLTRLVLANAVFFKGDWEKQFEAGATTSQPFRTGLGGEVSVPIMYQMASFLYGQHPGLQVLSMPFVGGDLSMVILLPETNDGLQKLEAELSAETLKEWTGRLRKTKVMVQFPKFKAESSFGLNQTMQTLGMPDAFTAGKADFSGMSDRDGLFISDAVHKAFVEVNEQGTEAAAATGIAIRTFGVESPQAVFRADHPFLYLIRHEATGAILFMGRMVDPSN